ncbi:MAG: HD domain-containing protein, partial [Planctomycetota bacterium]
LEKGCDLSLAYAVLLHDVGKPGTQTFADRIRFNNHDALGTEMSEIFLRRLKRSSQLIENVSELVAGHMRMASLQKMRKAKLRRLLQNPLFPLHLELHRLDCIASHNKLEVYEFGKNARIEEEALPEPVQNIIAGKDLIAMGYKPSKLFSEIIEKTQDEFLEERISNIEEAKEYVKSNFPL